MSAVFALFRVLFPSWKFFDRPGHRPRLHYRLEDPSGTSGPWLAVLSPPRRAWYNVVFNPHGNLYLALESLLDRLVSDLQQADLSDPDSFAETTSYQLVKNLVETALRARTGNERGLRFQFKVSVVSPEAPEHLEDALLSLEHEVGA